MAQSFFGMLPHFLQTPEVIQRTQVVSVRTVQEDSRNASASEECLANRSEIDYPSEDETAATHHLGIDIWRLV